MSKQIYNLKENETKIVFDLITDSAESNIQINLNGKNAKGYIYGIFVGNDTDKMNINHTVVHNAEHTESDILVKGILSGKSIAEYNSLIKMNDGVKKAVGNQKEDTLLLSHDARVNAVPNLEVAHNDVKCSHAVSTTNVDKTKLFYMNSRGIETDDAVKELAFAHLSDVLDKVDEQTRAKILTIIENKIK